MFYVTQPNTMFEQDAHLRYLILLQHLRRSIVHLGHSSSTSVKDFINTMETVHTDTGPEQSSTEIVSIQPEIHMTKLLTLLELRPDRFVGPSHFRWFLPRTFGGLTVAQALVAASRSVKQNQRVHSLHSYFLRGGDATQPIIYKVSRTRDGHSFSNRRVEALQHNDVILEMLVSFKSESTCKLAFTHQQELPVGVPPPEQCKQGKLEEGIFPGQVRKAPLPPSSSPAYSTNALWFKPDFPTSAELSEERYARENPKLLSYDAHLL
mmetsp:Transcript_11849/g.24907  ORF Transcript_11849/g.24907 Transcript_11849/m.24907 type:complete len:265 (+) Transcript_11849:181-975(+)